MTAVHDAPVPALPPESTPAAIRDALIDEERAAFEHAYRQTMAVAAETLDLTPVLTSCATTTASPR